METVMLMVIGTVTALVIVTAVAGRSQHGARRRAARHSDGGAAYVSTGSDGCDAGDAGCDGGGDGGGGGGD
jgi:hypothetical protein